jgi:hypothetical protein
LLFFNAPAGRRGFLISISTGNYGDGAGYVNGKGTGDRTAGITV